MQISRTTRHWKYSAPSPDPTIPIDKVKQRPSVLAGGASWWRLLLICLVSLIRSFSPTTRYRLKYCLKGPLKSQTTDHLSLFRRRKLRCCLEGLRTEYNPSTDQHLNFIELWWAGLDSLTEMGFDRAMTCCACSRCKLGWCVVCLYLFLFKRSRGNQKILFCWIIC